jgi:predicted metal-dependent peptidase
MAVNGKKSNPRVGYRERGKVTPPYEDLIYCPENVDDNLSAEEYYKMINNKEMGKSKGKGQGQGQGQGQEGQEQGQQSQEGSGEENPYGNTVDDHSTWSQSDVSEDEARQIVKDISDQASQKSQGHVPGHLKEILKSLDKPVVHWKELLRALMGTYVGNRRLTYSRRNRRHDSFGKPGVSHHAACTVSVIVDTSGSVSTHMLQQFFTEIEAVCYRAKVFVLQWDHAFQGYGRYRRGDWKRIHVRGRGGTDMAAPVKWLEEQGMIGNACIMLTDGFCNWPDKKGFPMIFVVAREGGDEIKDGPKWGNLVHMKVN